MKYPDASDKNRAQWWRLSERAVALLITLILSACSNDGSSPEPEGKKFPPISENQLPPALEDPVSEETVSEDPVSEELIDNTPETGTEGDSQFPSAPFDSGPESLIVTGIDSGNPDATSAWLVNSRLFRLNSRLDSTGDATVDLVRYGDDYPVSSYVDFYTAELDTCFVKDPDATPTTGGGEGDGNSPPPSISGGDTVVINTPSGPWFTFNRTVKDGQFKYTVDDGLPGELLPAGATLSIPGDDFPTVSDHPLYDPTPPERLLPEANIPISVNSAYAWIPSGTKTIMRILLIAYNAENSFVDFVVSCDVRDDGSFTMPAEVTDFISTTPYRLQARYDRAYNRIDVVNGIIIRQFNEISE